MSGGGETHATASNPCERIHDQARCDQGVYNPTTNTKHDCTWTDTSSNPGLHAASVALGTKEACAMEAACPVGYYSNKGDGYCQKIPDGHRCKKARAGDSMCATPDQVIGAGTVMQTYCGVYDATSNSWDWQYLTHGGDANGDHDLSDINSQAIELGCAKTEKCPAGTWSNTGDYNCLDIPAGQKCSANVDGSNITATSVGCKEVVDCGSLEYSAEKTNLCQTFSGCPVGKRVLVAGESGRVTWDSAGERTDFAGSDNTCEACVAAIGGATSNGFNADVDLGNETTSCTPWTGCASGEALNTYVGDETKDNGACHDCNNNYARLYASGSSLGLTATNCVTADACLQNGEKKINCTDFACPCGTCDAGQSGITGDCTDCVAGKYSATAGNGTCDLCPANQAQDTAKQTSCTPYGAGVGCKSRVDASETTTGCIEIEDCPAGKYSGASDSECIDIPDGYECATLAGGTSAINATSTKCASIDRCPAGSYSGGSSNECTSIPAGTFCSAAADDANGATVTVAIADAANSISASTGCKSIQGCDSSKFSLGQVNLCTAFPACATGTYVKTAASGSQSNGGTDPGYTSDRDCELCSATGAKYRSDGPATTQLTVETNVCVDCGTCSGGTPVVDTSCTDTAATKCRAVATGDCGGSDCMNGVTDCPSSGGQKTCGSCEPGYALTGTGAVKTCDPITCACTDGTAVETSENNDDGGGNDANTCLNSATVNCASCDSGFRHDIYGGAAKECNEYWCTCPNGVAKTGTSCTSIASEPDDCQQCNTDYEHVDGTFTKADNSINKVCDACKDWEYAVAGTNTACAVKSFICPNGTPAANASESITASHAPAHGAENCASCKAGYKMVGITCVACADGTHTDQDNTASSCDPNVCTCSNGQAAAQGTSACVGDNDAICTSCGAGQSTGGGYELVNSACVACETGEISENNVCRDKQCTCTNGSGQGAVGSACADEDVAQCVADLATCDSGYTPKETSTGVWKCVKKCGCTNGGNGDGGAVDDECTAAGAQDCATCAYGFGRYLKEGTVASDEIYVCVECSDFGSTTPGGLSAFDDDSNDVDGNASPCPLDSCPKGQGYSLPVEVNSAVFQNYVTAYESNTFRGHLTISNGDFICRDCPSGQYSDTPAKGQCKAIDDSSEVCVTYKSGAASGEGCEKICPTQNNAATYNGVCSITSCDSGYEVYNGACVAVCATGYYRNTGGNCVGECPATASNLGSGNDQYNVTSCSSVQDGDECTATCADTARSTTTATVRCNEGADATTAGTWTTLTSGTCLLNTGEDCSAASECADAYCYDSNSDNQKTCQSSPQTCDGTTASWTDATRRTTAQGGGGSASGTLTTTEADASTIIFRCTYGPASCGDHATNTFTCSSGTFTGDGTADCPSSAPTGCSGHNSSPRL